MQAVSHNIFAVTVWILMRLSLLEKGKISAF